MKLIVIIRFFLISSLLITPGCHHDSPSSDSGVGQDVLRVVAPATGVLALKPGGRATVGLRLWDDAGAVLVGRSVNFAIFGDPRGSTMATDRAVTNDEGQVSLQVQAGAVTSRFSIRATAGKATTTVPVEVSDAGFGTLQLTTSYQGTVPTTSLVLVRLYLVDGQTCGTVDRVKPARWLRRREVAGVGIRAQFAALPVDQAHTFMAQGFSGSGTLLAGGCVDMPPRTLKADQLLQLTMQLSDLRPTLAGRYVLNSRLTLPRSNDGGGSWPRPMVQAMQPWDDLVDCPNDPAQLLLDCAVDAVDSGDPLDCKVERPSAVAAAVNAERGSFSGVCRGDSTARGGESLDKNLAERMGQEGATLLKQVAALGNDARSLLGIIGLRSTLEVGELDGAGVAAASHSLTTVTLGTGSGAPTFAVEKVGLSRWRAVPVRVSLTNWQLSIAQHSFSLRYGLLVQTALNTAMQKRSLGATSKELARSLVGLLKDRQGGATVVGCGAMDRVVCGAARLATGCFKQACTDGVAALAAHLNGGAAALDKPAGPALTLQGTAELKDSDADLTVDTLGTGAIPGSWTATLTLAGETVTASEARFSGKRLK